ncbi:MAG TPA: non-heme iron oxygenase ferredoxin subunit [Roseiflexaceae bacterium]|jgi:3-phenylpropionate/trans-cinnamate dioxygenase ferredoxin subunit|nr:non-heme iron oxygenase ferredoxin subunit [Roseiflexaceae bacterium]
MAEFVKIASVGDVPTNEVRAFEYEGQLIAVYNCGGTFYATSDICTHEYTELHEGFFDTDDCSIECPLHGARFSVETGAVLALPAYQPLEIFAVQVVEGDILVEIP